MTINDAHILLVVHSLVAGGAERVSSHLANHWVEMGRRVTVVTLTTRKDDFYSLDPRIQRIELELAGDSPNLYAAVKSNLMRVAALRRVLREQRPDYVVGMMATVTIVTILAAIGLGIPTIVSERNHPPHIPLGAAWEKLRKLTYARATRVVMLTSEGQEWLTRTVAGATGCVIPNPVPFPLPVGTPLLPPAAVVPRGRKLLLAAGRLAPQKGFDLLLSAFGQVARDRPDWMLVILGEGAGRSELERQLTQLGLADRVVLPGKAGNIGDWYSRAAIYVMSSRFEGFPNTLVEAMAHGCPVVSFDCDTGPRDIIRSEVDGLLVSPAEDVQALAMALARVMDDEQLRSTWAMRAHEVRERFSVERIFRLWDDMFSSIVRR